MPAAGASRYILADFENGGRLSELVMLATSATLFPGETLTTTPCGQITNVAEANQKPSVQVPATAGGYESIPCQEAPPAERLWRGRMPQWFSSKRRFMLSTRMSLSPVPKPDDVRPQGRAMPSASRSNNCLPNPQEGNESIAQKPMVHKILILADDDRLLRPSRVPKLPESSAVWNPKSKRGSPDGPGCQSTAQARAGVVRQRGNSTPAAILRDQPEVAA